VRRPPDDTSKVFFGASVELEGEDGKSVTYRLLGADEIDPKTSTISIDSPMGRALLGKRVDSEFTLNTPSGTSHYLIVAIDYQTSCE
ncbi:MAG: GreA/GreB family elongation factor, partial [Gammaproteobacteria bacterium]|nr:GreA/GreB family elongation factor [Gammaproteobacteria bacterium]